MILYARIYFSRLPFIWHFSLCTFKSILDFYLLTYFSTLIFRRNRDTLIAEYSFCDVINNAQYFN